MVTEDTDKMFYEMEDKNEPEERNFTLSELTKSDTAIRKGINNNPNAEQDRKIKITLCENILQPVRDHFGRVKVTSVSRSELCLAIGSSAKQPTCKS